MIGVSIKQFKSTFAVVEKGHFSDVKDKYKKYTYWTCEEMIDAVYFLLDNIFICFSNKIYRQVVGIPMGTNCAPLIADLFSFML